MKHRHKLQQQRRRAASGGGYFEVDEANDEQPQSASKRSKRRLAHQLHAEGGRPKHRLDKIRRRRPKHYDAGGAAGPPGAPGGGAAGPLSNSGVPTMTANFPIAPGLFLGKGPPPAPAPQVDNSMNQLLGQINSLKDTGAFDKKSSSGKSDDDNSSGNRRGGRIRNSRAATRSR